MPEITQASSYEYVTLVDRAALGGCEIIHDGVRIVFKPGQVERPVPKFLAAWLFSVDQQKVHTKDGRFVHRFALKDAADHPDLLEATGPEIADQDPIEIDPARREGWDTETYAPDRGPVREIALRRRPEDFANLGAAGGTFSAERTSR